MKTILSKYKTITYSNLNPYNLEFEVFLHSYEEGWDLFTCIKNSKAAIRVEFQPSSQVDSSVISYAVWDEISGIQIKAVDTPAYKVWGELKHQID